MGSRNVRRTIAAVSAVVVGIGFVGTQFIGATLTTVGATYDMSDGDLVTNLDGTKDWIDLASGDGCGVGKRVECKDDEPTGRTDDSFGNGTKEDTPIPSVVTGSIPNNKSDLSRYYVASEVAATGQNDNILYLAWERVQDPSGTTNMDFEFNRNTAVPPAKTPVRTHGDLLVSYDLANGGVVPTISYRRWIASSSATPSFGACQASVSPPCWSAALSISAGQYEGKINTAPITDPFTGASLSARTFGETAINLNASGILPRNGDCYAYGSVYLKSRSSDSFTAAVKDFIAPTPVTIANCGSLKLTKTDATDATKLAGASFALYTDNGDGNFNDETAVPGAVCQTGDGTGATTLGECTITGLRWGSYWLKETVAPAGYTAAGEQKVLVAQTVGASTFTVTNQRVLGSVTVVKSDDATSPIKVAGATFALYVDTNSNGTYDNGTDLAASTAPCTTVAVTGQCVISSVPWGTYFLVETGTPTGYNAAAAISVTITKDVRDITQPVTNVAVFKVITLVCDTRDNQLVAGSVNYGSGALPTATAVGTLADSDICTAALTGTLTTTRGTTLDPSGIAPPA